jgi:hypothetical protein
MSSRAIRGPRVGAGGGTGALSLGLGSIPTVGLLSLVRGVERGEATLFFWNHNRTVSSDTPMPSFTTPSVISLIFAPSSRALIKTSLYLSSWAVLDVALASFASAINAVSFLASSREALVRGLDMAWKYRLLAGKMQGTDLESAWINLSETALRR